MPTKDFSIKRLLSILNSLAPFTLAEPWDNVGLMVGNPDQSVRGIMVALDPTAALFEEAISQGCNAIITHHPLIFHPLKTIRTDAPLGRMLKTAFAHDLAIIACHTNLDLIAAGVSNAMAEKLKLQKTASLSGHESAATEENQGFGKIGHLPKPLPARQFLDFLLTVLELEAVQVVGPLPEMIHTVALCGGSGSELAEQAHCLGAQVYITGEVKHSVARWAEDSGFCVIDAGHYSTERLIVPALADMLKKACATEGFTGTITTGQQQKNPMQWITASNYKP